MKDQELREHMRLANANIVILQTKVSTLIDNVNGIYIALDNVIKGSTLLTEMDSIQSQRIDSSNERIDIVNKRLRKLEEAISAIKRISNQLEKEHESHNRRS